jgi:hypothetical protein
MKFNFNNPFIGIKKTTVKDENGTDLLLSSILGNAILLQSKGGRKFTDWGYALNDGLELNLDRADKKLLYDFIENDDSLSLLSKSQLHNILDSQIENHEAN